MAQDAPAPAAPAAPMAGHAHAMGPGTGMAGGGCAAMMAKMDSSNAQIASLTEAMNKATGSKKTEAMAAVVNALVQDRLAMQEMMHQMHSHMEMMGGMGGMGPWASQVGLLGRDGLLQGTVDGLLQGWIDLLQRAGRRPGKEGVAP